MATNLTASQQLADLVRVRHEAHPEETNMASWKAVQTDPDNADLVARCSREMLGQGVATQTPKPAVSAPGDGVASVRQVGRAMPKDGQPLAASDAAKALAEARATFMREHNLSGVDGIRKADVALKLSHPELFSDYNAFLSEQHIGITDPAAGRTVALTENKVAPTAPVDVRFAEAVNATMARCGLVGTAGREAATSLVIRTEPELAAEYTRRLRVRL